MKKKTIGIIAVGGVILLGAAFLKPNGTKALEVQVAASEKGTIAEYVEELGVAASENTGSIFAPTAGRVTEVTAAVGDNIEKGMVVVKIDSQQIARQIMELEAQKAGLAAQYNEAVKPIDPKEIEKIELRISAQKRKIEEAKRQHEISKTLYEAEAISYKEYHGTVLALEQEEAVLEAAELDLALIKKPVSGNIGASYKAQIKQLDIQMEQLRKEGQDYVVTAPLKGTVMTKNVEVGSYLQPGMELMTIGDAEALYIESDVLVSEIGKLKIGSEVVISHKDLGIEGIRGTIRKIYPQAFSKVSDLGIQQKRIKVEVAIEDKIENLRPGYDLDLKMIVTRKEAVLLIPESAVFEKAGKNYVFVNENDTAVLREIQKGIESERKVEVLSGLVEGEKVILTPDNKLEDGTPVKAASAS